MWNKEGTYNIKVKAQDEKGVWSNWSDPLSISIPKNKSITSFEFKEIFNNIIVKIIFDYL